MTPQPNHAWEPPGDRACAICGIEYDEHPEPDYDIGALHIAPTAVERYRLVPIEDDDE